MASYEVVNNVAIITCQNPPVNQLSYALRVGLFDGMEKALANPDVVAVVIAADGKTFIAGADIKEFSNGVFSSWISDRGNDDVILQCASVCFVNGQGWRSRSR